MLLSPGWRAIGILFMVTSVIDPVIARLPERLLAVERRETVSRARMEQAQILPQAAERALD